MKPSLSSFVREKVDPKQYYAAQFDDIRWTDGVTEPRVKCCFHDEKTPSLSLNPKTGAWFCHGCEAGGNSIVAFHAQREDIPATLAAEQIYQQFVRPTISNDQVKKWSNALRSSPSVSKYLTGQRFIRNKTAQAYRLGWNGTRITIPVQDQFGLWVNVKLYDPLAKKRGVPKMLNYRLKEESRSFGSPAMIFPIGIFELAREVGYIVVCEGEFDALALISLGVPACTSTAGSKSWPKQLNELFRGLEVIVAYDNDKDGNKYAPIVLRNLSKLALRIKRLIIPKAFGKDVTDWIAHKPQMRKKLSWIRRFENAKLLVENKAEDVARAQATQITLNQASEAQWMNKLVSVDSLVSGKTTAPYILPQRFRVTCNRSCETCPLVLAGKEFREVKVDPASPNVLRMVDVEENRLKTQLLAMGGMAGCKPSCGAQVDVVSGFNLEEVILIPTVESRAAQYVMRRGYYVGHGLHANRSYRFQGTTVPHPRDQQATHLFTDAKPVQDEVETFSLTTELKNKLKAFRPKRSRDVLKKLHAIAEWQSRHITHIRRREDLHTAVDLAFHSVKSFSFNGEFVHRGMLDVLVLGDTRCGKGFVTEGLCRYYGLGQVVSGENCSFAGLVGGCQQIGRKWVITWGQIALNNDRLVIIDEASSLKPEDFGKMSRVRSEGVAEITKVVKESTQANTRLVWLANPRSGRELKTYNHGIEAIKELVGNNEDISRFDYVLTVSTAEVDSEIINSELDYELRDFALYPKDLCRALILWAWSRKPDQIRFTASATSEIITQSIAMGKSYSPAIPLVQAENIRIKLAKISAAIAARTFSCDESCDVLIVDDSHVRAACETLRAWYAKPSMGYDTFSRTAKAATTLNDFGAVNDAISTMDTTVDGKSKIMQGLLELHQISPDNLADFVGDQSSAKAFIGSLVRCRALTRIEKGNWYLKNPAFSSWLRETIRKETHATTHKRAK